MFSNKLSVRRFLKLPAILFGASLVLFFPKTDAEAASFGHVHTSSCYQTVTGTCTSGHTSHERKTNTYHCVSCGRMTTHSETVYWDVCDNGIIGRDDFGYRQVCSVCGHVRSDDPSDRHHSHTYSTTACVCGKSESTSAADVSLNVATPGFSNTSVILDAGVSVQEDGFSLAAEPYDFGEGFTSNSTYEVTENGTYTVSVKDASGRVVSTSVTVDCIDRTLPTVVNITKDTEDWSEGGVMITVEAADGESGLAGEAFSFNGGEFTASNTYHVTSNGTVSVRVKDAAGNIGEGSIEIHNVGRDPAVVAAEKAAAERAAAERAAAERAAAEKAALEKAAAEKAAAEKAKLDAEKKAKEEKALKEKAEKEKAGKEKTEKMAEKRDSAEKEAADKLKLDKLSAKNGLSENNAAYSKNKKSSSGNDLSGNGGKGDVSGNGLITVTDLTGGNGASGDLGATEIYESLADIEGETTDIPVLTASAGTTSLKIGAALLATGLILFSFFNYVYVSENGHIRLIAMCKVQKSEKNITVIVGKGKLKEHGRYCIYFCPWNRIGLSKKNVSVEIEGSENLIRTDERTTFSF